MNYMGGWVTKRSGSFQIAFQLMDPADNVTPMLGLNPSCSILKSGATSFVSANGGSPAVEISNGIYYAILNSTDLNTAGPALVRCFEATANDTFIGINIVAYDPNDIVRLGLTALPNAVAGGNGGLGTVDASNAIKVQAGTGANQISLSSGKVTVSSIDSGAKTGFALSSAGVTAIVDGVWNALTASYASANTFGAKIGSLIADLWNVSLPGSYGSGKAGNILGVNLDNAISTRSTLNGSNITSLVSGVLTASGTELSAVPTTAGSLTDKINFIFQYFRNRRNATASIETMYKEDGTTALGTAAISDDGTTANRGEMS